MIPSGSDAVDPYALADAAARALAERTGVPHHDAVVVLGSGWAAAVDSLGETVAEVPVAQLPGFRPPVAQGQLPTARSLRLARHHGGTPLRLLALLGRTHLYEGHGPAAVVHAVRTAAAAGCHTAVLTNANGSLRPRWRPGTGVLLRDHLNLTFTSPLVGPRFVDLSELYSPGLRALARRADPDLVEGVYAMLPGPHYETVAEALMLRTLGADIVGMSTVLEAIAAREARMAVLALSVVTAASAVDSAGSPVDPEDVVRVAAAAATRMGSVIAAVLSRTANPDQPDQTEDGSDG
ncbi:MAG TPA: purine-nucleoside phosphorylase [Kineosporiaceae bacterium]|nr:purine-nucleoside phosphorylase [Kineosporiaceae bacterium]